MNHCLKIAVCEDDKAQRDYIRALVSQWAEKSGVLCETVGYVSAEQLMYSFDGELPYQI